MCYLLPTHAATATNCSIFTYCGKKLAPKPYSKWHCTVALRRHILLKRPFFWYKEMGHTSSSFFCERTAHYEFHPCRRQNMVLLPCLWCQIFECCCGTATAAAAATIACLDPFSAESSRESAIIIPPKGEHERGTNVNRRLAAAFRAAFPFVRAHF